MAKAYWIATYRAVHDPQALAAYAQAGGARPRQGRRPRAGARQSRAGL
jgi:hypothetical protein